MAKSKQEKALLASAGKLSKDIGLNIKQSEEVINLSVDLERDKMLRAFYNGSKSSIGVLMQTYFEPLANAIKEKNFDELAGNVHSMLEYCIKILDNEENIEKEEI